MPKRQKTAKIWYVPIITIFLGVILVIGALFVHSYYTRPVDPNSTQQIPFTIKKGESVDQVSQNLRSKGLVAHPFFFKLTVKRLGLASSIQAGNFLLSPSQSASQLARSLTQADSDQIQVTLIEGWRREEMAAALSKVFADNPSFSPDEFIVLTQNLEGQLYPDTYLFEPDASTQRVVTTLTDTFKQKVTKPLNSQITQSSYSLNQILTMASIVEREARGQARPLVAGILWKRLENDWPLQADATLQYAKGYDSIQQTWWPTPLAVDKELNSPYNTYQNTGLPPAPIANPSLDSIQATLNPTSSDYWYYITDNQGRMHYSQTYDQHLDNVNTYLR